MHCLADTLSAQAQGGTSALCPVWEDWGCRVGATKVTTPDIWGDCKSMGRLVREQTEKNKTKQKVTSKMLALGSGRQRTEMAGRKFPHECQFRAWGALDALGTLKGQRAHRAAPPRRREERPGGGWLARAWGSHPLLRGQFPQPETRARVISWKAKWHGDRISKAQINWLTGIVGLRRGWGWVGGWEVESQSARKVPMTPH